MSSKVFKTKLGKDGLKKGATYKPGQPGPELDLAAKVAKLYLSGKLMPDYTKLLEPRHRFDSSVDTLFKALDGHDLGELDHFLFFEMLLQRVGQATDFSMTEHTHCLIDPLVQLLYMNGLNNFSVDLLPLPAGPIYCGSFLTGKEGNPLTASYFGEKVSQFAYDSKDSVLSYKGETITVGHKSTSVVTLFDGVSGSVGWRGNGCDYELKVSKAFINPYENHNCTFRVESDVAYGGDLRYLNEIGFFRRGNRILMSDRKGGWDEVSPK